MGDNRFLPGFQHPQDFRNPLIPCLLEGFPQARLASFLLLPFGLGPRLSSQKGQSLQGGGCDGWGRALLPGCTLQKVGDCRGRGCLQQPGLEDAANLCLLLNSRCWSRLLLDGGLEAFACSNGCIFAPESPPGESAVKPSANARRDRHVGCCHTPDFATRNSLHAILVHLTFDSNRLVKKTWVLGHLK